MYINNWYIWSCPQGQNVYERGSTNGKRVQSNMVSVDMAHNLYVRMYRDFSRKAKGLVLPWGRPQFMNLHLVRSCTQRSCTLFVYFGNLNFPHLIYYLESSLYNIHTYACVMLCMYLYNVCIVCLKRSCWNDQLH